MEDLLHTNFAIRKWITHQSATVSSVFAIQSNGYIKGRRKNPTGSGQLWRLTFRSRLCVFNSCVLFWMRNDQQAELPPGKPSRPPTIGASNAALIGIYVCLIFTATLSKREDPASKKCQYIVYLKIYFKNKYTAHNWETNCKIWKWRNIHGFGRGAPVWLNNRNVTFTVVVCSILLSSLFKIIFCLCLDLLSPY